MVTDLVAPARLQDELTWCKLEAYTTWLSGMGLLVLVYYLQAELFMIDAAVLDLTPWLAAAVSLAGLALGWLAYDLLCRSPLGRAAARLATVGFVVLTALSFLFTQLLGGCGLQLPHGAIIRPPLVATVVLFIIS